MKEPPLHPDQKYIDGILNHDRVLLKEIYGKPRARITSYIKQNNGTEMDAEDIFQSALIGLFEKASKQKVRLTCPFEAFLLLICKRMWINQLRKNKNIKVTIDNPEVSLNIPDKSAHLADEIEESIRLKKLLQENLLKVSDKCREILQRYYSGDSLKDIASSLGKNYSLIRRNHLECIKKLRSFF